MKTEEMEEMLTEKECEKSEHSLKVRTLLKVMKLLENKEMMDILKSEEVFRRTFFKKVKQTNLPSQMISFDNFYSPVRV